MASELIWFFGGLILGIVLGNKEIREAVEKMIFARNKPQPPQTQQVKGGAP